MWVRGAGYDPLVAEGDPRSGNPRIKDEPGLRLPPTDDPDYGLWKSRWRQLLRNRAALHMDDPEHTSVARTVKTAADWLERRADIPGPFLLWLDLFSPHGPWDVPQPYKDQYASAEPDEFEADEEGDLIAEDDDIGLEDVVALNAIRFSRAASSAVPIPWPCQR